MKTLFIVTHKNPDTDSIVSALVLSKFLKKIKGHLSFPNFKIKAARVGKINRETKFVLDYFKIKSPILIKNLSGKNVFLTDHSSYGEAGFGIEKAKIFGVLDHHRLGGLTTPAPIFYRAEPLGSTSTILFKMYKENNINLSKKSAGLLLSGVLSDTLKFTSPTTAEEDKKNARELASLAGIKIKEFAQRMFDAKSDVRGIPISELITMDYKEYKEAGARFAIGVLETTNTEKLKEKKDKIFFAMKKHREKNRLDLFFFALVNILEQNCLLFLPTSKEKLTAEEAFHKKTNNEIIFLPGVVSRKKQILPALINALIKLKE